VAAENTRFTSTGSGLQSSEAASGRLLVAPPRSRPPPPQTAPTSLAERCWGRRVGAAGTVDPLWARSGGERVEVSPAGRSRIEHETKQGRAIRTRPSRAEVWTAHTDR